MLTRPSLATGLCSALLLIATPPAHAGEHGQLNVKFALSGQTETFVPGKRFGPETKTPRKGKPFLYAAWRQESGTQGAPGFKVGIATMNVYQDEATRYGLGLVFDRDRKTLHYASRCSPNRMPKCDPATQGVRHDAAGGKIVLNNAVFERVTLDDVDPKDVITVTGELRYKD